MSKIEAKIMKLRDVPLYVPFKPLKDITGDPGYWDSQSLFTIRADCSWEITKRGCPSTDWTYISCITPCSSAYDSAGGYFNRKGKTNQCYYDTNGAYSSSPVRRTHPHFDLDAEVQVEAWDTNQQKLYGSLHELPQASVEQTGWDPEIFVVDEKNHLIPAFEFLPDKAHKRIVHPVSVSSSMHEIYADGFAAEWTTWPGSCHGWGMDTIREGLQQTLHMARLKFPKASLSLKNHFNISPIKMKRYADDQIALGCTPSLNAYGVEPVVIDDPRSILFRSAGGHVHFKTPDIHEKEIPNVIKTMDMFLGIPSVALFDGIDVPIRRTMYGRAGEYRRPSYGIEYRVLSNAWLGSPEIAHLVMDVARSCVSAAKFVNLDEIMAPEEVQEIINVCDAPRARKFVEDHWNLFYAIGSHKLSKNFDKSKPFWMEGVLSRFKNYENVAENWNLPSGIWNKHSHASLKTWGHYAKSL